MSFNEYGNTVTGSDQASSAFIGAQVHPVSCKCNTCKSSRAGARSARCANAAKLGLGLGVLVALCCLVWFVGDASSALTALANAPSPTSAPGATCPACTCKCPEEAACELGCPDIPECPSAQQCPDCNVECPELGEIPACPGVPECDDHECPNVVCQDCGDCSFDKKKQGCCIEPRCSKAHFPPGTSEFIDHPYMFNNFLTGAPRGLVLEPYKRTVYASGGWLLHTMAMPDDACADCVDDIAFNLVTRQLQSYRITFPGQEVPIYVGLPESYHTSPHRRYPVVYAYDGQGQVTSAGNAGPFEQVPSNRRCVDNSVLCRLDESLGEFITVAIPNVYNALEYSLSFGRRNEVTNRFESSRDNIRNMRTMHDVRPSPGPDLDDATQGNDRGKLIAAQMSFIKRVLVPTIDRDYRTVADRRSRVVMGQSNTGHLVTYTMARLPELFHYYLDLLEVRANVPGSPNVVGSGQANGSLVTPWSDEAVARVKHAGGATIYVQYGSAATGGLDAWRFCDNAFGGAFRSICFDGSITADYFRSVGFRSPDDPYAGSLTIIEEKLASLKGNTHGSAPALSARIDGLLRVFGKPSVPSGDVRALPTNPIGRTRIEIVDVGATNVTLRLVLPEDDGQNYGCRDTLDLGFQGWQLQQRTVYSDDDDSLFDEPGSLIIAELAALSRVDIRRFTPLIFGFCPADKTGDAGGDAFVDYCDARTGGAPAFPLDKIYGLVEVGELDASKFSGIIRNPASSSANNVGFVQTTDLIWRVDNLEPYTHYEFRASALVAVSQYDASQSEAVGVTTLKSSGGHGGAAAATTDYSMAALGAETLERIADETLAANSLEAEAGIELSQATVDRLVARAAAKK